MEGRTKEREWEAERMTGNEWKRSWRVNETRNIEAFSSFVLFSAPAIVPHADH